jgi:hypothetical protein
MGVVMVAPLSYFAMIGPRRAMIHRPARLSVLRALTGKDAAKDNPMMEDAR